MIGIDKLIYDLQQLGFENVVSQTDTNGGKYAVLPEFEIPAGSHIGKIVSLAIPAPDDFPRSIGSSIHVKAQPHLYEFGNIPNVRNIVNSALGIEWQYWSYRFHNRLENTTSELITQINEVFRKN